MTQHAVPFLLLRGGTSRGPYFNMADLPRDRKRLAEILIAAVGGGHVNNIDGVGGGAAITTKVAMLSRSTCDDADIDYLFAQVAVAERSVDFAPTCGNILVGVGPAAIEMGLIAAASGRTDVRIRAVNTGALVTAGVRTPGGKVTYAGDLAIDGVPGTAAPVSLEFRNITGSRTGTMFPTGQRRETINGVTVTCMDVAMPMVIARADEFGLSGHESRDELDAMADFFERMESIRRIAGERMGLGEISRSVVPKFGLLAPPRSGGSFAARYFMPWNTHPTLAVTGSQCLAACALAPGTVAEGLMNPSGQSPVGLSIEHPLGQLQLSVKLDRGNSFEFESASVVRTARLIARGELMIPEQVWAGPT
ncbi:MAG: 4-oxalomesaconate tautomerase [Rhodobacteraceae bacterium]|nr:4-oxalomesaconate tautomerase [Paracoccaceae bacterium]